MKTEILFTQNINQAKEEIELMDGKINQQFSDNLFTAELPDGIDVNQLNVSTLEIPQDMEIESQIAYHAWKRFKEKDVSIDAAPDATHGLPWDTEGYQPPKSIVPLVFPQKKTFDDGIAMSSNTSTSLYMVGSIAVGIVIVSGSGNLAISQDEATLIIGEVQEGLHFLASEEPRAKVSFVYDIKMISVNVVPGNLGSYESAEAPWRNAALQQMGYAASRQGSIQYVNNLRNTKNTNWAYVAYFTKYPLFHFAYAVDEKLVMSYFNDGWKPENINKVFAHETCHLFGAADEYDNCSCNSVHGFLSVPNSNCKRCATNFVPCLMYQNELTMCQWTRKQIGWDESLFPTT